MGRVLVILLFFVISSYASVGTITGTIGDVYIIRDLKSQKIDKGDEVFPKDLLFSRAKSKVQITFIDQTVISIGQKSSLLIEEYVYDQNDTKKSKCSFMFSRGSFKSVSGKIGKIAKENFKLKTQNANISIKGTTTYAVQTTQNGVTTTTNMTTDGATLLTNSNGESVLIEAGYSSRLVGNNRPLEPIQTPQEMIDALSLATDTMKNSVPNLNSLILQNTPAITPPKTIEQTQQNSNENSIVVDRVTAPLIPEAISSELPLDIEPVVDSSEIVDVTFDTPFELDNESSWGEWDEQNTTNSQNSDNQQGNEEIVIIEDPIIPEPPQVLTFSGQMTNILIENVSQGVFPYEENSPSGSFDLTLDLGGGTDSFMAEIAFNDGVNDWSFKFEDDTATAVLDTNFSSTNVTPVNIPASYGGIGGVDGGSIIGNFNDTTANGNWDIGTFNGDIYSISGIFEATKQ